MSSFGGGKPSAGEEQPEKKKQGKEFDFKLELLAPCPYMVMDDAEVSQAKAKMLDVEGGKLSEEQNLSEKRRRDGFKLKILAPCSYKVKDENEYEKFDVDSGLGDSADADSNEYEKFDVDSGLGDSADDDSNEYEMSDFDFYLSDSADDDSDDRYCYPLEKAFGKLDINRTTPKLCKEVGLCTLSKHVNMSFGRRIVDLYKVKIVNTGDAVSGLFYGIVCARKPYCDSEPINYYCVDKKNAVYMKFGCGEKIILPLSGPKTGPPVEEDNNIIMGFGFKFNGEDVFGFGLSGQFKFDDVKKFGMTFTRDDVDLYNCHIQRDLISCDPCRFKVVAYYGYYQGVWATVYVKLNAKKGVSRFNGLIYSRSCLVHSRIRLLSIPSDSMCELQVSESNGQLVDIHLTRNVVSVPSYSSLIIGAVLKDQAGEEIVRGKAIFPAQPTGRCYGFIGDDDGVSIHVLVEWACT